MITAEERLKSDYACPRCRGSACVVHHVALPHGILPLPFGPYLTTTCVLCGYTEFYDRSVYENLEKPAGEDSARSRRAAS